MAVERSEVIELGLTRTDTTGEVLKAILVLKTDKSLRGGLTSSASPIPLQEPARSIN